MATLGESTAGKRLGVIEEGGVPGKHRFLKSKTAKYRVNKGVYLGNTTIVKTTSSRLGGAILRGANESPIQEDYKMVSNISVLSKLRVLLMVGFFKVYF